MVDITLTELCQELRNWFDRERYHGVLEISGGTIYDAAGNELPLQAGMYFRIIGSWFNDGVHVHPDTKMHDEVITGSVWLMAVPSPVIQLAEDIAAWRAKYEVADSSAMSPYMSESFGGYSYQKGNAISSTDTSGGTSWKRTFASRMNAWRKL